MTTPVSIVTICSTPRLAHVQHQLAAIRRGPEARTLVVWVGGDSPPVLDADNVITVPPGEHGLRLAAARNAGADHAVAAGASTIIFLDADCIPGPALVAGYVAAATDYPEAVLCGPVTYLADGADSASDSALVAATKPHAARPSPPDGQVQMASTEQYPLFWSLSFALTAARWRRGPRFDERYEGYGAEDTDYAFRLRDAEVGLAWVGGAHAYHQYHPTEVPPWQHLDDILRNGQRFYERWAEWPMTGWLHAFEAAGAICRSSDGWERA